MSATSNLATVAKAAAPKLTIGVGLPGEGYAAFGAAAGRVIADLQEEANSPDEEKAAIARHKLAAIDSLVQAQKADDIEAERKAAEVVP